MGEINLKTVREASQAVYLAAKDISEILTWAADEIERLRKVLEDEGYNIER